MAEAGTANAATTGGAELRAVAKALADTPAGDGVGLSAASGPLSFLTK